MSTSVIIPVYNESERVQAVAETARLSWLVDEVVAVDDGSTDDTLDVLEAVDGITVISHESNFGKGEALDTGVRYGREQGHDTAVFLDGDLLGLETGHIADLLAPLDEGGLMAIGYLGLRKAVVKKALLNKWGALSGQRAIKMPVWDLLNKEDRHGFNIEAALNARLRQQRAHHLISRVALEGVSHVGKREKLGSWPRALWGYTKTYAAALDTYMRIQFEEN